MRICRRRWRKVKPALKMRKPLVSWEVSGFFRSRYSLAPIDRFFGHSLVNSVLMSVRKVAGSATSDGIGREAVRAKRAKTASNRVFRFIDDSNF